LAILHSYVVIDLLEELHIINVHSWW